MGFDNKDHWIDLHLHTDKSDGTCTPKELVQHAEKNSIKTISITDHDTIGGIKEASYEAKKRNIKLIPGIEISAKYQQGTLHILGYGIDTENQEFINKLSKFQEIRKNRNIKIIQKLNTLGINIEIEEMLQGKKGVKSLGRPHIASLLIKKGVVSSMDDAFSKYLGKQGSAFVDKEVFSSRESIEMIHDANGIAVLAHPSTLNLSKIKFKQYLNRLKEEGLNGLEVYSSAHPPDSIEFYKKIADEMHLLISGGSDFHGLLKKYVKIGIYCEDRKILSNMVSEQLLKLG